MSNATRTRTHRAGLSQTSPRRAPLYVGHLVFPLIGWALIVLAVFVLRAIL